MDVLRLIRPAMDCSHFFGVEFDAVTLIFSCFKKSFASLSVDLVSRARRTSESTAWGKTTTINSQVEKYDVCKFDDVHRRDENTCVTIFLCILRSLFYYQKCIFKTISTIFVWAVIERYSKVELFQLVYSNRFFNEN